VREFPATDEVALLVLMPHDKANDPASWLIERYGLPRVDDLAAWRDVRHPECCGDSAAPPLPAHLGDARML